MVFSVVKNTWEFRVDYSIKSPFSNNRFIKPMVDIIGDDLFVSFIKNNNRITLQFFELQRGGIKLKYAVEQ